MVAIAGNSLLDLGIALAAELGNYFQMALTTTAASQTQFVSTQMIDSEAPAERYGGWYAYSHGPSVKGEQHRVTKAGFTGSSGTFVTNGSYSANPASGTSISLLGTIPWINQDGLIGIRECVNRALRKLWIRYRLPITSTGATVNSYDLGAYWWASRDRFLRLWDPDPGSSGHSVPSSTAWKVVQNGEVWTLELGTGFPTGDIFFLEVEAPGASRLYSAQTSLWTQQSSPRAGLSADGDACLGNWNTVFQCALYECMRALAKQAGGARKAYWAEELVQQGKVVSAIKAYQMDDDDWVPNADQSVAPGSWNSVVGDHGFWSRW